MILVTGAGGFLGQALVSHLKNLGLKIIPLYRGNQVKIESEYWEADLTQSDHLSKLQKISLTPDTIIHLAGFINIALQKNPNSPSQPLPGDEDISKIYLSNTMMTANLLDYALKKGTRNFIYASSQTVYGMPAENPLKEDSPCFPLEHYANSKLCNELILQIGAKQGIHATCLRFPGIYAPSRRAGLVYTLCRSAIDKKNISINLDYPLALDILYLEDLLFAFEKSLQYSKQNWDCFNIATGEVCNINLLAQEISDLVPGCKVETWADDQPDVILDASKAKKLLGWEAHPRRERLRQMLQSLSA